MPREIVNLTLQRQSEKQPWGFRIVGGTDEALILKVEKVNAPFVPMCSSVTDTGYILWFLTYYAPETFKM